MYRWYEQADLCVAYLNDVEDTSELSLSKSVWFTRGWTLQELIAPSHVALYNKQWNEIGTKLALKHVISKITKVQTEVLDGSLKLASCRAARKLRWAATRKTSRVEDQAYCLMGLFGVNMPLLYGERHNAFRRLQELILAKSQDQSLFVWRNTSDAPALMPLFAQSPRYFESCEDIEPPVRADIGTQMEMIGQRLTILVSTDHDTEASEVLRTQYDNDRELIFLTIVLNCYTTKQQLIHLELMWYYGWYRTRLVYHACPPRIRWAKLSVAARRDYISVRTGSSSISDHHIDLFADGRVTRRIYLQDPMLRDQSGLPVNSTIKLATTDAKTTHATSVESQSIIRLFLAITLVLKLAAKAWDHLMQLPDATWYGVIYYGVVWFVAIGLVLLGSGLVPPGMMSTFGLGWYSFVESSVIYWGSICAVMIYCSIT